MKKYKVLVTPKGTDKTQVYENNLTEEQAQKICEAWGWSYDDGKISYWMRYEEQ